LPVATFTTGALLPGCKKNNSLAGNCSIAKYTVSFRNNGSSAGPATIMYDQEGRVTKLSHAQLTDRLEFDYSGAKVLQDRHAAHAKNAHHYDKSALIIIL